MSPDELLSAHFRLREMITTQHRYLDNTPSPEVIAKLTELCRRLLEPVREQFGPLLVTSGYRCPQLNVAIGGSKVSAHIYGCAADFVSFYHVPTRHIVEWIASADESHLPFDQVIDEYSSTSSWVHLAMVRPVGNQKPRREALAMRNGAYSIFA